MKLDLSCPIELRGYTLSCTDGMAEASVRLYNLTNRRIASFEAIAKWRCQAEDRGVATPFRAERLRAGAEDGFRISLSCNRLPNADSLDLVFTAVRFEDGGPDWRAGDGMIVDVSPIESIPAESLAALRSIAGEDAVCFPVEKSEIWRCVCGRTNSNEEDTCVRCHRDRAAAIAYTQASVLSQTQSAPADVPAAEDDALISDLHARYLRQKARLFRRTLAVAFAALALTAMLVLQHQPIEAAHANAEVVSIYSQNTQED